MSIPLKPHNGEKEAEKVDQLVDHQLPPFYHKYQQLVSSLPLQEIPLFRLRNYEGFWYRENNICGVLAMRESFTPHPTDIFLASSPKSGTTWLKALTFAIVTRKEHHPSDARHPLLNRNPHDCVPIVEELFASGRESTLDALPPLRLLSTHMPYSHLPQQVRSSECRVVYVCREPKDTAVSGWHFANGFITPDMAVEPLPFAKYFDKFCEGALPYGPVWDHCLEYWTESLRRPGKVLFLNYESMKEDPIESVRRLAEFVGHPFSPEEEGEGMVEEIVRLCSLGKLSSLDVNKTGNYIGVKNSLFFRKGRVGDWKNNFTTEMAQVMDKITQEKLAGSGLSFGNE